MGGGSEADPAAIVTASGSEPQNPWPNDAGWSNEEFDQLLAQGDQAATPQESTEAYQKAQDVLVDDMPGIPLWYSHVTAGHGQDVSNVEFDIFGVPRLHAIIKS